MNPRENMAGDIHLVVAFLLLAANLAYTGWNYSL